MKLQNVKVDHKAAAAGEWVKNIPEMDDLELQVRGHHCALARVLRNKLIRSLPANVRNNPDGLPPEATDKIEAQIMADVLLLDWRNIEGTPFSKEKAVELLNDPDYVFFREAVSWAATRVGRQVAAAHGADVGNSETTSAGT